MSFSASSEPSLLTYLRSAHNVSTTFGVLLDACACLIRFEVIENYFDGGGTRKIVNEEYSVYSGTSTIRSFVLDRCDKSKAGPAVIFWCLPLSIRPMNWC